MNKEEIIEQLKELTQAEDVNAAFTKAKQLAKNFRFRDDDEGASFYDKELADKFNTYMDEIRAKAGDISVNVVDKKNEIIAKASEIVNETNIKQATQKMKDLMTEWKEAGHANKDTDDELWEKFNAIRNEFNEKKDAYYDGLKEKIAESKIAKEGIIATAKDVLSMENMKEAGQKMNELMDSWKKAGFAGKDSDDSLWTEFSAIRKEFFEKRNSFFESMKSVYAERTAAKEEIIKKAKVYLARSTFTDEEKSAMEELKAKWKEIGSAGKDNENKLWEEFKAVINRYNDNQRM